VAANVPAYFRHRIPGDKANKGELVSTVSNFFPFVGDATGAKAGATTFSIMSFSITTFSIKGLFATLIIIDT
jgi:hypothetical protein